VSVCDGSFAPGVVCTSSSVGIFVPFLVDGDSTTTAMVVSRRWWECCAVGAAGRLVISRTNWAVLSDNSASNWSVLENVSVICCCISASTHLLLLPVIVISKDWLVLYGCARTGVSSRMFLALLSIGWSSELRLGPGGRPGWVGVAMVVPPSRGAVAGTGFT
jgi:hypothetical protein